MNINFEAAKSTSNTMGLTILVIATRRYTNYAKKLIESIEENIRIDNGCQVLIFTDKPDQFPNLEATKNSIDVIEIPSLGWPFATLLRYSIFRKHFSKIYGEIVLYLDADTEVVASLQLDDFESALGDCDVALVLHPGFFGLKNYYNKLFALRIGPWETSKSSSAFVRRSLRKRYVCGGVWFGRRSAIKSMVHLLAEQVDSDNNQGIIAKWHDESHLNNWFSRNPCSVLDPSWAYSDTYAEKLSRFDIEPIIRVIDKPETWKK
jgi:hypothetical protein